jgi:hypothetical protein
MLNLEPEIATAFQVPKHAVLIVGADFSDFSEEAHDALLGDASYAHGGTN